MATASGYGVLSDGVYGGTAGLSAATQPVLNLTTAWNVNAAYEHFWNAQWRTSVYGGYAAVSYNAQANAMICAHRKASAMALAAPGRLRRLGATTTGTPGGSARAPSGTSRRTSTWVST